MIKQKAHLTCEKCWLTCSTLPVIAQSSSIPWVGLCGLIVHKTRKLTDQNTLLYFLPENWKWCHVFMADYNRLGRSDARTWTHSSWHLQPPSLLQLHSILGPRLYDYKAIRRPLTLESLEIGGERPRLAFCRCSDTNSLQKQGYIKKARINVVP